MCRGQEHFLQRTETSTKPKRKINFCFFSVFNRKRRTVRAAFKLYKEKFSFREVFSHLNGFCQYADFKAERIKVQVSDFNRLKTPKKILNLTSKNCNAFLLSEKEIRLN